MFSGGDFCRYLLGFGLVFVAAASRAGSLPAGGAVFGNRASICI